MRSFAIVIRRAYFEAKKRRKYAKKRSSKQVCSEDKNRYFKIIKNS